MPKFLLFLCAGAALTFEGCQTVAGDIARQDMALVSYLQNRWVVIDAPGAVTPSAELFCPNGEWRAKGEGASAGGRYVLKASSVCVTDGDGHTQSCRTFSRAADGRYVTASGAAVEPVTGASDFAISYACNSPSRAYARAFQP